MRRTVLASLTVGAIARSLAACGGESAPSVSAASSAPGRSAFGPPSDAELCNRFVAVAQGYYPGQTDLEQILTADGAMTPVPA